MNDDVVLSPLDTKGVRTITLNRATRANALSETLVEALLQHINTLYSDGTKVLVIAGSGKNFCGGFDFSGYKDVSAGDLLHRFVRIEELLQQVYHAPFASIACVQGAAFGAGADLVVACTHRVGSTSVRFRFPGFRFGVALGTRRLASVVGNQRAQDILLNNKLLGARQALECSILTHLVEQKERSDIIAHTAESVSDLNSKSLQTLLSKTRKNSNEGDLAELARSVSRPGLHDRIAKYLEASTE